MNWNGYVYHDICEQVLRENHKTSVKQGNYKDQQTIPDDTPLLYLPQDKSTYDTVCRSGTEN